jgi:hypothetical protein
MPTRRNMLYASLRRMGMSQAGTVKQLDVDPQVSDVYEEALAVPVYDDYIMAGNAVMTEAKSVIPNQDIALAQEMRRAQWNSVGLMGQTEEQRAQAEAIKKDAQDNRSFWRKYIVDPGMSAVSVLATPQQMLWHELAGGNWREGVSTALINKATEEQWAQEGYVHQYIDFGDVVDGWTDGGYENMMTKLNEGNWFQKWVMQGGLKVGEFAVDVVADPMNIVYGAGAGKMVTKMLRKSLPLELQAELSAKAVMKTESVVNYKNALADMRALVKKTHAQAKASGTQADLHKFQKAKDDLAHLVRQRNTFEARDTFHVMPMARPLEKGFQPELYFDTGLPKYDPITTGIIKGRVEAYKLRRPITSFADLGDEALALRLGLGPDDAEAAGEALRMVGMGVDPGEVTVRRILADVTPVESSTTLFLDGVGRNGRISHRFIEESNVLQEMGGAVAALQARKEYLRRAFLRRGGVLDGKKVAKRQVVKETERGLDKVTEVIGKAGKETTYPPGAGRLPGQPVIQEELDDLLKGIKALDERTEKLVLAMDNYKSTGVFDEALFKPLGIKPPKAPRRPFDAWEYLDKTTGNQAAKFLAMGIQPGSYMPKPGFGLNSYFVREPMRIINQEMPGTWDFMRGRLRHANAETTMLNNRMRGIFLRSGVYDVKLGKGEKMEKVLRAVMSGRDHRPMKVNKINNKILAELLDTPRGSDTWNNLIAHHGLDDAHPLVVAADEIRKTVLDPAFVRMGLDPEDYIDGYLTHALRELIKPEWISNGTRAPEFNFMRGKHLAKLPGFLKDRLTSASVEFGAVESMDFYLRGFVKHMHTNPMLDELQAMVRSHVGNVAKTDAKKAANIQKYFDGMIANLNGEPSTLAKLLMDLPGGEVFHRYSTRMAGAVGAATYSSALALNPRYPIMATLQAINTTAAEYGILRTLKGIASMADPKKRLMVRAMGLDNMHSQMFEDGLSAMSKMAADVGIPGISPSITDTEFFIRGITAHASIGAQLNELGVKTLGEIADVAKRNEILAQAVRDAESINHVFGVLGKPVGHQRISRTGSAIGTQFMSFPFKQTETILAHTGRDVGFLFDYLMYSGMLVNIGHKMNLSFGDYVGLGYMKDHLLLKSDRVSMPAEVLGASIDYFSSLLQLDITEKEKVAKFNAFKESLTNLIPAMTAWRARERGLRGLVEGEVRDSQGNLIRKDINKLAEATSLITGVKGTADTIREHARNEERVLRDRQWKSLYDITKQIRDRVRDGKQIDMDLAAKHGYLMKMNGLGSFTSSQLMELYKNELELQNVEERIREMGPGGQNRVGKLGREQVRNQTDPLRRRTQ